jgi:2-methylfumaryl-CoA isomerase
MTGGILSGLRVVEGSAFVAAPLGGLTLAQLGAEVIRFDAVGGGLDHGRWPLAPGSRFSLFWAGLNKGKKSIAVDFRQEQGRELLTRLITLPGENAGIFSTNFPARGWLDYDALKAHREDLIMVCLLGRRDGGSEVDYTVNPQLGLPAITGPEDDSRPVNHVLPAWDLIAGQAMATAVLAAERHRRINAEGQRVTLALKDMALATLGHLGMLAEHSLSQQDRPRQGNYLYGAFGRDFETRDGHRIMVVGLTASQWKCLLKATELASEVAALGERLGLDLNDEGNRYRARHELAELFEAWTAARDMAGIEALFNEHRVTWAPYRSVGEALRLDPDLSEDHPILSMVEQPGVGRWLVPGSPLDFSATENPVPTRAPRLGEHTDEILLEHLGLSEAELGRLHDSGVVAGPD